MSSWFACVVLLLTVVAPAFTGNSTAEYQKRSSELSTNPGAPVILQKQTRMSRRLAKERYQRSKLGPGDKTWERELLEMRLAITEKLDNLEWTLRHLDERLGRLEEETDRVSSSCDGGSVGLQLNLERIENSVATLALRLEDKLKTTTANVPQNAAAYNQHRPSSTPSNPGDYNGNPQNAAPYNEHHPSSASSNPGVYSGNPQNAAAYNQRRPSPTSPSSGVYSGNRHQQYRPYGPDPETDELRFKENDPKDPPVSRKPENLHRSGHRNGHRKRMKNMEVHGNDKSELFKHSKSVERNMREANERQEIPVKLMEEEAKEEVSYPDGDSIPSRDRKLEVEECAENDESCSPKKEEPLQPLEETEPPKPPPPPSPPKNVKRCQQLSGRGNKVTDLTEVDCYDLMHDHGCPSGVYTVQPPKIEGSATFYCDMETKGGGWTVIQRRGRFGSKLENFNRTWNEYRKGFGSRKGEFWIGNDILHSLTYHRPQTLRIELYHRPTGRLWFAHYSHFKVGPEEEGFRLLVSGFEGDAKDGLSFETGQPFVTLDHAPSDSLKICSTKEGSGWWYSEAKFLNVTQCNHHLMGSNLNAPFREFTELSESTHSIGKGSSKETRVFKYAGAIYWRGKYVRASHFDFVAMKMRPEIFSSEEKIDNEEE